MTDANGKTPTNGGPKPRKTAAASTTAPRKTATSKSGDATPADIGPSTVGGDVSSEQASVMAKAKPAPTLSEHDSVLLAGLDEAHARAQALRDWALIRREEAKDAVRTHPLGSSVVVFAAGMIFGLLLARR